MANAVWMDSTTAATQDFSAWYFNSDVAKITSTTSDVKYGPRGIQVSSTNLPTDNLNVYVRNVLANAGRRITFWFTPTSIPVGKDTNFAILTDSNDFSPQCVLYLNSANKIGFAHSGGAGKAGSTVLSVGTSYRITWSYVITATNDFTFKVYIDGVLEFTVTQADGTLDSITTLDAFGFVLSSGSSGPFTFTYVVTGVYIDDGTDSGDPGDVRVTAKLPNATGNANAFDTAIGSETNRWDYVSKRPLSISDGWKQAAITSAEESYGIESISQGDIDITGSTLVARLAWLYGKRDQNAYAPATTTTITSSSNATTTTFPSVTVSTNDLVYIGFADLLGGSTPTFAKSAGTATISAVNPDGAGPTSTTSTVRLTNAYFRVTGGGTLTMQMTHAKANSARAGVLAAFPQINTSAAQDKVPAMLSDGTSQYDGPASTTLTQADELLIACHAFNGPVTDTDAIVAGSTGGATFIEANHAGTGNATIYMGYRAVSATTSLNMSMTDVTANRAGVQSLQSFKSANIAGTGSSKLVDDGSDIAITLTTSEAMFTNVTTTATYPSASGKIGMKSTGNPNDTYLYECGVLIAYIPGVVTTTRGMPFGPGGTAFNGGRTFKGIIA